MEVSAAAVAYFEDTNREERSSAQSGGVQTPVTRTAACASCCDSSAFLWSIFRLILVGGELLLLQMF